MSPTLYVPRRQFDAHVPVMTVPVRVSRRFVIGRYRSGPDLLIEIRSSRSKGRDVAANPPLLRLLPELCETSGPDRLAHARHQLLVIGQVDPAQQHHAEDLVGAGEMVQ